MELKLKKENIKKENLNKIITIILIGLLLLIVIIPVNDKQEDEADYDSQAAGQVTCDDYSKYYEDKLKNILEKSYGEGSMEVMIHMKETQSQDSFYSEESNMEVDGVLIVAAVNDAQAVSDISFAVCALFDLPAHKVAVIVK